MKDKIDTHGKQTIFIRVFGNVSKCSINLYISGFDEGFACTSSLQCKDSLHCHDKKCKCVDGESWNGQVCITSKTTYTIM